jgi:DNA modification methylase
MQQTDTTKTQQLDFTNPTSVFEALLKQDWSFENEDSRYLTHGIHPYPAKFPPQIPARLISNLSKYGELVWDPFGGSGTSALEALLAGRRCISTDANPLSELIGKAKTTPLSNAQLRRLKSWASEIGRAKNQLRLLEGETFSKRQLVIPNIPNIDSWFKESAISELSLIRSSICDLEDDEMKVIASVALSRIVTRVSNQGSETRYVRVDKNIKPGEVLKLFSSSLDEVLVKVKQLRPLLGDRRAQFSTQNVAKMQGHLLENGLLKKNSIDLIVTSPPYPNATDYHLYNRFRLYWLGFDPKELFKIEIGSHLRHQKEHTNFADYLTEMTSCLKTFFEVLKPSKYAAIVVGDAIYKGKVFKTDDAICKVGISAGFEIIGKIPRNIHQTKRSFIPSARRARAETIVVLRKPSSTLSLVLKKPSYKLRSYEIDFERSEIRTLLDSDPLAKEFGWEAKTNSERTDLLRELTFVRSYCGEKLGEELTWQAHLENGGSQGSVRKNSKYVTHGIHYYKGKFYPQLAKVLLNISKTQPRENVLDPFCGSGTVLLESYLNGFRSFGCDLNPLAVEMAKAKLEILLVDTNSFDKSIEKLGSKLSCRMESFHQDRFPESCRAEMERWFPKPVLSKVAWLLDQIDVASNGDYRLRNYFLILASSIVRRISQQEPSDLRIRKRKTLIEDAPVIELFKQLLKEQASKVLNFHKVIQFAPHQFIESRVWRGDSRDPTSFTNNGVSNSSINTVLTSPPYATALPYIDTDRLSLLLVFGMNSKERSKIEDSLIGSREISNRVRQTLVEKIEQNNFGQAVSATAQDVITKIHTLNSASNVGFRRRNMASLLFRYYNDMAQVFRNLDSFLANDGRVLVVIGDNYTVAGNQKIQIPTTKILEEIGINIGWLLSKSFPITVTTENLKHVSNAITKNTVLWFEKQ